MRSALPYARCSLVQSAAPAGMGTKSWLGLVGPGCRHQQPGASQCSHAKLAYGSGAGEGSGGGGAGRGEVEGLEVERVQRYRLYCIALAIQLHLRGGGQKAKKSAASSRAGLPPQLLCRAGCDAAAADSPPSQSPPHEAPQSGSPHSKGSPCRGGSAMAAGRDERRPWPCSCTALAPAADAVSAHHQGEPVQP